MEVERWPRAVPVADGTKAKINCGKLAFPSNRPAKERTVRAEVERRRFRKQAASGHAINRESCRCPMQDRGFAEAGSAHDDLFEALCQWYEQALPIARKLGFASPQSRGRCLQGKTISASAAARSSCGVPTIVVGRGRTPGSMEFCGCWAQERRGANCLGNIRRTRPATVASSSGCEGKLEGILMVLAKELQARGKLQPGGGLHRRRLRGGKKGPRGRGLPSAAEGRKSPLSPMITVFLSPLVSKVLRRTKANSAATLLPISAKCNPLMTKDKRILLSNWSV